MVSSGVVRRWCACLPASPPAATGPGWSQSAVQLDGLYLLVALLPITPSAGTVLGLTGEIRAAKLVQRSGGADADEDRGRLVKQLGSSPVREPGRAGDRADVQSRDPRWRHATPVSERGRQLCVISLRNGHLILEARFHREARWSITQVAATRTARGAWPRPAGASPRACDRIRWCSSVGRAQPRQGW